MTIGIACIGCGYVAGLYAATFQDAADIVQVRGIYDADPSRRDSFAKHYGLQPYDSYEAVLADPEVQIVVNLTNPHAHHALSKQALLAGKHVYSEKPLALALDQARELVTLAKARGLHMVCAPSSALGEAAQTLMRAVRDEVMGTPRLVYAEIDDGMIHRIGMERWRSATGVPWPAKDELATGCTLEHAGYALSWLVIMFGSARRVVSFSKLCVPDRGPQTPESYVTPDFSCACIEFETGVVARLTNSIIAPHDHRLRIFCDDGALEMEEIWDFGCNVYTTPLYDTIFKRQMHKRLGWAGRKRLAPVRKSAIKSAKRGFNLDFMVGVRDLAEAIRDARAPRLGGAFSLHVTEVSLAIQYPEIYGTDYTVTSSAQSVAPMGWAT
ncbi:MAG: Gfo/Idh/MocA family oxidoreductase [Pseudomonadota bacterium]